MSFLFFGDGRFFQLNLVFLPRILLLCISRVCAFNGWDEQTGEQVIFSRGCNTFFVHLSPPSPFQVPLDRCRHGQEEDAFAQRACWGTVGGRLLYANDFHPRKYKYFCFVHTLRCSPGLFIRGNYPVEILYFCENHVEDDAGDEELFRCEVHATFSYHCVPV